MQTRTRRVAENDVAAVREIYDDPSVNPFLTYKAGSSEDFARPFAAMCRDGNFYAFEADGVIAGFYSVSRGAGRSAHVAMIESLAVAPKWRGTGVALDMMREALRRLRNEGVIRVELAVETDNPRGLAFYRKLGFEAEGVRKRAFERDNAYLDDVVMVKFLDEGERRQRR